MKNQKGITLIALVVTIIVLLILAGISIAMLTGENGILGNAKNAKSQNAYYGAEEQMKLAYMAVRTEIAAQTVANSSYDATTNKAAADTDAAVVGTKNLDNLKKVVVDDLADATGALTNWNVVSAIVTEGTTATITITYTDSSIDADSVKSGTPKTDGQVIGRITLTPQSASFEFDV